MKTKKKLKMPHAYVVLLIVIAFCTLLTWILPAGTFERVMDEELGREIVVAGSYTNMESTPVGLWHAILAIFSGVIDAADIIFFIVFATAYVTVLTKAGALNALVGSILRKMGTKDHLLIPVFMFLFGLGGTTFGMYEECYALVPAFMVIMMSLGYDKLTGGVIIFLGAGAGCCSAVLNPFTVGIASSVAGVPLTAPAVTAFRIICFFVFMAINIWYVMRYAKRVKLDQRNSVLYGSDEWNVNFSGGSVLSREEVMELEFTGKHKISLLLFVVMIVVIAYGVIAKGFYLAELSGVFMIFMVITGIINKMSASEMCETFVEAAQDSMFAALLIGLSRSLSVILTDGNIIDTVVYYLSSLISGLPKQLSAVGMVVVQNLINFFIPSGSGQAVVTMPIMAPVADLSDLSRQVAVAAYQFGDGFSNTIWPTAVAAECGLMGISLGRWYKFMLPLFGILFVFECIMINVGIFMGI